MPHVSYHKTYPMVQPILGIFKVLSGPEFIIDLCEIIHKNLNFKS